MPRGIWLWGARAARPRRPGRSRALPLGARASCPRRSRGSATLPPVGGAASSRAALPFVRVCKCVSVKVPSIQYQYQLKLILEIGSWRLTHLHVCILPIPPRLRPSATSVFAKATPPHLAAHATRAWEGRPPWQPLLHLHLDAEETAGGIGRCPCVREVCLALDGVHALRLLGGGELRLPADYWIAILH